MMYDSLLQMMQHYSVNQLKKVINTKGGLQKVAAQDLLKMRKRVNKEDSDL